MIRTRKKTTIGCLLVLAALGVLTAVAVASDVPTGYLIVPWHHEGDLGPNDIPVTATELEGGWTYRLGMGVSYHSNPRTPPEGPDTYCSDEYGSATDEYIFLSDGEDVTHVFSADLPDCHCQVMACFGLLYWDTHMEGWAWNQDPRATQCVDIWSDCLGEGCTPGYWRNHFDMWVGFSPSDDFDTVFGVDLFDPDKSLGETIWLGGGGIKKLARHGTAALLSAANPDVGYPLTVAEVIAAVQAGDSGTLAGYNELGCPLN